MIILHVGSYGSNVGDNIAIENIRKPIQEALPEAEFISHSFKDPYPLTRCNSCLFDAVIIGGGGLLEGTTIKTGSHQSGYKLDNVEHLECPVFVCGVGFNFFRGLPEITGKGIRSLKGLMNKAQIFSVRSDGSYEIAKRYHDKSEVREIPDPGLITDRFNDDRDSVSKGFLGVSFNRGPKIMRGRNVDWGFLAKLGLVVMPHTRKDYKFIEFMQGPSTEPKHHQHSEFGFACPWRIFKKKRYNESTALLDLYHDYDFSVNMRGHSQMVSFAKNIPSITLSSQDKLAGFCKKHGLDDYCVDTRNANWKGSLNGAIEALKNDSGYLSNWYKIRHREYKKITATYKNFMGDLIDALSRLQ